MSPKDQNRGMDRRRHERIPLNMDWGAAQPLLGAQLLWPNYEASGVLDMSHSGLAVTRPALLNLTDNQSMTILLHLGRRPEFETSARVAWLRDQILGLELMNLSLNARQAIDDFLEDRLVGRHLRAVSSEFFSSSVNFTHWYHGPKDTNVFLWIEAGKDEIKRAEVELDGQMLVYSQGEITLGGRRGQRSLEAPVVATDELLEVAVDRQTPLVKRVLEVLSQIEEAKGPIRKLLEVLVRDLK